MDAENRNGILLHDKSQVELQKSNGETKIKWKYIKYQIILCNVAGLFTMNSGVGFAFTNLLLHEVDAETSSWFASLLCVSSTVGALVCGVLMDKVGRKFANVITGVPCVLAWFLTSIATKDDVPLLYSARLLTGLASGLSSITSVYVSEISHKNYRPMLLSWLAIQTSFGILLTTILNMIFTWREAAAFFAVFFTIVMVLIAILTPESPVWLAAFRSDMNGAKRSLKLLYSNAQIFDQEWKNLKQSEQITSNDQFVTKKMNYNFTSPSSYKPICTLFALFLLQSLSGIYPCLFYAIDVFAVFSPRIGRTLQNETFLIFGIIRLSATVACCLLSIKVGRRVILILSSVGMLCSSIVLVICTMDLNAENIDLTAANINDVSSVSSASLKEWIAIVAYFVLVFTSNAGVMPIPWVLIVELLPTELKGVGGTIILTYANLLIFGTTKFFPFVLHTVDISYVFGFFGIVSVFLIFLVYFYIPETLGKTFKEISDFFR